MGSFPDLPFMLALLALFPLTINHITHICNPGSFIKILVFLGSRFLMLAISGQSQAIVVLRTNMAKGCDRICIATQGERIEPAQILKMLA